MSVPSEIPVKVQVKTIIHSGQSKEEFQLEGSGRYFIKNNAYFLQYEEIMEDQRVKTIVKVAGNEALILRSGPLKMRLPFRLHTKQQGSYEIAAGTLDIETRANRIDHSFNEDLRKGSVELLYDLSVQGSRAGTYHLEIIFEEEEQ